MRYLLLLGLAAISLGASAAPTQAQLDFVEYLKSDEEPKVKDATWMTDDNLYVGVIDDGSNRRGFAEYLCMVAPDHGAAPAMIKIVDIVKVVNENKFHELGKAYCR
ncbi:MAG: hypothetical protein CVV15_00305 [Gammaproteobacteria bacterium HGW-Gammaproteobacteria-5]|nr:MAG: hypothetical protein CVV15_00305 [Gammaproteobacteria bacterium HGW-Gammaproteobacteria-5]